MLGQCVVLAVIMCFPPSLTAESKQEDKGAACIDLLVDLGKATAQRNYDMLVATLDQLTRERLGSIVESEFGGSSDALMLFLERSRHPARFSRVARIEAEAFHGECHYFKIVRTANYSTYHDKSMNPVFEDKPVVLWICMTEENGTFKIRLDYPIHDITYLLQ